MTAATIPGTGLDWVTFTDEEHSKSCQFAQHQCAGEATHAALFLPLSGCDHDQKLYCPTHAEYVLRAAAARVARIGLARFYCSYCGPDVKLLLLQMDAL